MGHCLPTLVVLGAMLAADLRAHSFRVFVNNFAMMAMVTAASGMATQAQDDLEAQFPPVAVYVQFGFGATRLSPIRAEGLASEMFAKAGVRISWRKDWPKSNEEQAILIDITSNTPESLHQGYPRIRSGV